MNVAREKTFYAQAGDWFAWLCVAMLGVLLASRLLGKSGVSECLQRDAPSLGIVGRIGNALLNLTLPSRDILKDYSYPGAAFDLTTKQSRFGETPKLQAG
jgi:hypothetical protein